MRRSIAFFLALALTPLRLDAAVDPAEDYEPEVVQPREAKSPPAPPAEASLNLSKVVVEKRAASDDTATAQLGPSGSFWWLVGVIVVAGVILAVIL